MTPAKPEERRALKLRESPSPYISPLIEQLPEDDRPDPQPACATCPASMWRVTPSKIECLCRTAGKISWDGRQEPTLFCDGREAAILRLGTDGDHAI